MLRIGCRLFFLALPVMSVAVGLGGSLIAAGPTTVEVLAMDGTIVPAVADYIDRGISQAERNGAIVCVIELNTPGSWG